MDTTVNESVESVPGELELLFDLHLENDRQGPGSRAATLRAIELAGLDRSTPLEIADLGCGTGASTRVLAEALDARVIAVDFGQPFLDELDRLAVEQGLAGSIETLNASIDELPFEDERFDVVWSEGAIYNIGFEHGINNWRRLLKPGGVLVASEITWTTATRPDEIQAHWDAAYPEIDVASARIAQLEQAGYSPIGYFTLPESCWEAGYYQPIEQRLDAFLARHGDHEIARGIVEEEREEISLYRRFSAYYSYGVYIARRID